MSRTVCGICWCPYDEFTGECACPPPVVRDDTALLRQALAYVRWQAFGECRTTGHDAFPPTASELEAALRERLGETK